MIYSYHQPVGISHTGESEILTPAGAMDLLQDCAVFQTVEAKAGPKELKPQHLAWVANSWNICFDKPCYFLDNVRLSTWLHKFDRVFAHRNFTIENPAGEVCLRADSLWILMDMERQMPVRLKQDFIAIYNTAPRVDMPPMERRLKEPAERESLPAFPVPRYAVDPNHHVNNVWYVRFALEFLPEGFQLRRLKVEYTKSARYGDQMVPQIATEEDGNRFWVLLCDTQGDIFAKVLFEQGE